MLTAKALMLDLVGVASTSETPGETAVAQRILQLVRQDPYFVQNPHHCGAWDGGDRLGRPVIWALKKGRGRRTVVLSGHYDTVDTASYGALQPLALDPQALRGALEQSPPDDPAVRAALKNPNWLFGRGAADMKAGLAVNLDALYRHIPDDANLLMTAVSDEENLSAGARQAIGLYADLARQFDLDYTLGIITEPTDRDAEQNGPHPLIHGGAGKILPVVVARGIPAHSSNMLSGVNSAHLIAGVIAATEYDTAFVSEGGGLFTEPPAVQLVRDMKSGYDVSMPEYTACALNMTFFSQTDPAQLLDRLVDNCRRAVDTLLERYDRCFSAMAAAGQMDPALRRSFDIEAVTLAELETRLAGRPGFGAAREQAKQRSRQAVESGETMQWATICYIRDLLSWAGMTQPIVVVGIAPPYYPAVHTDYLSKDIAPLVQAAAQALETEGIPTVVQAYSKAMMDLSYMSCANPQSAHRVMGNIPLPRTLYDMDVDAMAALDIPTLVIGPTGRDIHQIGERVWLPDVEHNLPRIIARLVESVNGHADT